MHNDTDAPPGFEALYRVPPGLPVLVMIGDRYAIIGTYTGSGVYTDDTDRPDLLNISLAVPRCVCPTTPPGTITEDHRRCPLHYPSVPSELFAAIVGAVAHARSGPVPPAYRAWGDADPRATHAALAVVDALLCRGKSDGAGA